MKGKRLKLLLKVFVIATVAVVTVLPARADFVDGDVLVEWAKEYRRIKTGIGDSTSHVYVRRLQVYVMGIHDAHQTLLFPLASDKIFCTPDNVTVNQVSEAVVRFLETNSERSHEPGSILVAAALANTFPCRDLE